MTTKFEFDESWLSPATLKAWPFSTIEIDGAAHLEETLKKNFFYIINHLRMAKLT